MRFNDGEAFCHARWQQIGSLLITQERFAKIRAWLAVQICRPRLANGSRGVRPHGTALH